MINRPELPVSWFRLNLGDVVDYEKTVKTEPSEIPADAWVLELEDIEKATSRLLQRLAFIQRLSKSTKNKFAVGDILYGKLRPYLNKVLIADQEGYCTTEIVPISPNTAIDGRYLFYWFKHPEFLEYVDSVSHGIQMPRLGTEAGLKAPLILAPLNEQRRIVAKLDRLFARSRRAREELARVSGLCDRYKQAILAAAFRGDLTADWREENKAELLLEDKTIDNSQLSDLSNLPVEWIWTNVGQVAEVTGGLTKNQNRTSFEKKIPYLRVANVYANELRLNEVLQIGVSKAELERVKLKTGDLLIVEGNGSIDQIGRVALWNGEIEPCAHQNHLIKVRVGESISRKFLLYWLLSPNGRRAIELVASSSAGLHTLSIFKVTALPIPLCSIKEMKIIVQRVEKLFKAIDQMEQEYQKASKLLDRLEQTTLAKAFRGELVPQEPNDEPAAVLLQRIRAERQAQPQGKAIKSKQKPGGTS